MNPPVNWIEIAKNRISSEVSSCEDCAAYVALQLASLYLQRLPQETASALLQLLPASTQPTEQEEREQLQKCALSPADVSLGYPDFVATASNALGCAAETLRSAEPTDVEEELEQLAEQITATFFDSVLENTPHELRSKVAQGLPREVTLRHGKTAA